MGVGVGVGADVAAQLRAQVVRVDLGVGVAVLASEVFFPLERAGPVRRRSDPQLVRPPGLTHAEGMELGLLVAVPAYEPSRTATPGPPAT